MDTITALAVAALVTFRVTRLVTTDVLLRAPRQWMLLRLKDREMLQYLLVCDWCVSVYAGHAVAGAGAAAGLWPWMWLVPLGLAFSAVTGLLARGESE